MKKNNKITSLIFIIILLGSSLAAQNYKIIALNTKAEKLVFTGFFGRIQIQGYDGKEILFINSSNSSSNKITKDLIPSNEKNDAGLLYEKNGSEYTVTCLECEKKRYEYIIKVPKNIAIQAINDCNISKDIAVTNIQNDIEINNCQLINLENISGSIVITGISGNIILKNCTLEKGTTVSITAVSGNIKADFNAIYTTVPLYFTSISGNVQLTLPEKNEAVFSLVTTSGTIKSDFPNSDNSKSANYTLGKKVNNRAKIDGPAIKITTVNGNILINKR